MRSLRRALLVYILAGLALVLVLAGTVVFLVARHGLRTQLDRSLVSRARNFASVVIEEAPEPTDPPGEVPGLVLDYKGSLAESDLGVLLRIAEDEEEPIARSPDWPAGYEGPDAEPVPDGPPIIRDIRLPPTRPGGRPARARAVTLAHWSTHEVPDEPAHAAPATTPPILVVVDVIGRTDGVARAEAAVLGALVAGGLLAALGTGAAVWFGVRRGLGPLRRLGHELGRVDAGSPALASAPETYPEELRPVLGALARMLERVREALERERRFTDAAAHELRTPLAELRTLSDVARRWPEPERLRHAAGEAGAIAAEMQALLESLLASARGTEHAQPVESIALLPLARTIAAREMARFPARGIRCDVEGDDRAHWSGPRGAILAIVRNIIQNAAEYTPEGGAVRISARRHNGHARLEVENGPVTLRPDELKRLFEPFWRASPSRSDRAHRGLGLAIVANLCQELRLERSAGLTAANHLRIRISGPGVAPTGALNPAPVVTAPLP